MQVDNGTGDDALIETLIGYLLRLGVIVSGLFCLAGGIVYLSKFGSQQPDFAVFDGVEERFTSPAAILRHILDPSGRGLIQLGILVLIATPVARVALSFALFALRRDYIYLVITLAVLAVLIQSLLGTFL